MTQQDERPGRSRWRRRTAPTGSPRYQRFSAAVLAVGALAAAGVWVVRPVVPTPQLLVPFALLVVGFVVAELCTTDVNVRRVDWTITFTEIPLVLGILSAPFPVVLLAHVLVGVAFQLGRRATRHVPYNLGVMCLEVAVPYGLLWASGPVWTVAPPWVGAVLAVLVSSLVSTGCGLVALETIGANLRSNQVAALALRTLALALMNTTVGVLGFYASTRVEWGALMAVLLFAALGGVAYGYARMLREQRDLGTLADISLNVARYRAETVPGGSQALEQWQVVAEQIRDQIGAERVLLHLLDGDANEMVDVVAGRPLPDGYLAGADWREDPLLQLPGNEVRYHQGQDGDGEVAAALRARGAHEALVVPLRNVARLLGAVEAHDKASRWRGFARSDVRLLRTIGNHLSSATDNRRLVAKLRHDAYHDPSTGLLNRPGFLAAGGGLPFDTGGHTVLRVDLDVLSAVSDALGYAWGDRTVITAGYRLREELGEDVALARLEGGAFAALVAGPADAETAARTAERVRAALGAPYPVGRLTVEAQAYVGYVHVADPGDDGDRDIDVLLQRADVALRSARGGGNTVREYSATMGSMFLRRFQLVTQFRQAVDRGEVLAYYQPKMALASRQLLGVEALVRWQHPEFGALAPDEFVPAVEATGLIDVLTSFVTDQALRKVRGWLDQGVRVSVSVNLSVRSLADATFPDRVAAALENYGVPAELLTYEITESGVMADPDHAIPVLRRLHSLGIVLSLDDFGTGYSSLAYLRQLPVDEVKIDKSFVLGMATDLGDLAVVRSIVELGHSLGLRVVAEGVEDDAARDELLSMSCDIAQGYLISRPLPEDRLKVWLQARTLRAVHDDADTAIITLVS